MIIMNQITKSRIDGEFTVRNAKGEKIAFTLTLVSPDNNNMTSLPNLWKKNDFTSRLLTSYICLDVYVTDTKGNCWNRYNPQIIPNTNKINFDFMFEISEENKKRLLSELEKRAFMEVSA